MTSNSANPTAVRYYAFGDFVVDVHRRLLLRDGKVIPLTSKPFDVLLLLIQERERIVDKDEFLQRVWPNTFVQESTLVQRISILRKAFGLRPDDHDVIVTITGRGYQFVATVEELAQLPQSPCVSKPDGPEDLLGTNRPEGDISETVEAEELSQQSIFRPRSESWPIIWVMLVCLALVGLVVFVIKPEPNAAVARSLRQVVFDSALPREPTWSPDGRMIAYTSDRAGNPDIWIQSIVDSSPVRITTSSSPDWQPSWSPDGKSLLFRSERDGGGIFRVSSAGGEPTKLTDFGYWPRWSPKGDRILFEGPGVRMAPRALYVIPAGGGTPVPVVAHLVSRLTSHFDATLSIGWHTDGDRLSLWGQDGGGRWSFITASVSGTELTISNISDSILKSIDDAGLALGHFSWSPSGRYLYFEGRTENRTNLWRVPVQPATLAWLGPPERLTTSAGIDGGLALSPDGTQVAFTATHQRTRVWSLPLDTRTGQLVGEGQPVTSGDSIELGGDALVDGSTLAYRAVRGDQEEVWIRSTESGQQQRLMTSGDAKRSPPSWSPDGLHLAYAVSRRSLDGSNSEENPAVAILSRDGGKERLVTAPGEVSFTPRDWSADGRTILGGCNGPSGTRAICTLPLSDGLTSRRAMRLMTSDAAHNLYQPRFSPNNRWISFMAVSTKEPNLSRISLFSAAGSQWIDVTDGRSYDDKPRWAPDGRTLYFVSDRSGFPNLWARHVDVDQGQPLGEPFQVTAFQSPQRMLAPWLGPMGIAVSAGHVFAPIVETSGAIWILSEVDR